MFNTTFIQCFLSQGVVCYECNKNVDISMCITASYIHPYLLHTSSAEQSWQVFALVVHNNSIIQHSFPLHCVLWRALCIVYCVLCRKLLQRNIVAVERYVLFSQWGSAMPAHFILLKMKCTGVAELHWLRYLHYWKFLLVFLCLAWLRFAYTAQNKWDLCKNISLS